MYVFASRDVMSKECLALFIMNAPGSMAHIWYNISLQCFFINCIGQIHIEMYVAHNSNFFGICILKEDNIGFPEST